jgi:hypothetical protein
VQVKVQRKARSQRTKHCHGQEAEQEVGRRTLLLAGGAPGDGSGLCVDPAHLCSQ